MRRRVVVIGLLLLAACGGETKVEVAAVPDATTTTTSPTEQLEGPQAYVDSGNGYEPSDPDEGHKVAVATFAAFFDGEQAFATHFWFSLEDSAISAIEEQ